MNWFRRLAGSVAIIGGLLIVWGYVPSSPFDDQRINYVRLLFFWCSGAAIALGFQGRTVLLQSTVGRAATTAVLAIAVLNLLLILFPRRAFNVFGDSVELVSFTSSFLGWLAASLYGFALVAHRAAFTNLRGLEKNVTRYSSSLLVIAGPVATFGMDRLGLTKSEPYGAIFGTLGALGVGAVALSWLLMGIVLIVGAQQRTE